VTLTRLLHVALAAGAVAFVVVRSDPAALREALSGTDLGLAALAAALNLPVALMASVRSGFVFRSLGHHVPQDVLLPTSVVGFVAGGLTPAAAGELLRTGALRARAGVPVEESVVAVAYERVFALYLLALSAAVIFALDRLAVPWQAVAAAAATLLFLLPLLAARSLPRFPPPAEAGQGGAPRRAARRAAALALRVRVLFEDAALHARWAALTLSMLLLIALQYWLLARGVAGGVSLPEAWLALGVSTVAAVLSFVPLGLGVLDGSLAATLDRLGLTLEQGGVVALLVRATVTLPLVALAFLSYVYLQRRAAPEPAPSRPDGAAEGPP
jgi:uncharacterized membrane protein YbhN (UPF0104 family)